MGGFLIMKELLSDKVLEQNIQKKVMRQWSEINTSQNCGYRRSYYRTFDTVIIHYNEFLCEKRALFD